MRLGPAWPGWRRDGAGAGPGGPGEGGATPAGRLSAARMRAKEDAMADEVLAARPEGVRRGWLSLQECGRYLGISPDVVRAAIERGELQAYVKPATYRTGGRPLYKVSVADVDDWVRTCWQPYRGGMVG